VEAEARTPSGFRTLNRIAVSVEERGPFEHRNPTYSVPSARGLAFILIAV